MNSPARPAEAALIRHSVVRVAPDAWAAVLGAHPALADAPPVVREWAARGWPLMVRRAGPCDAGAAGVPLGLPLPPSLGKRRIGVVMPEASIVSVAPPPAVAQLGAAAPPAWRATLERLDAIARRHRVACRAFGSLAWQALTGLTYLSSSSDLDLLFDAPVGPDAEAVLAALLDDVAALADGGEAPMRIDGEVMRTDGAGANWRELRTALAQRGEVVAKTAAGVALLSPQAFLDGANDKEAA
ncbi:MAG: malonate decarboxylase holo-[acyl-carrier-protein] synthase [Burkholderia gladioli]